MRMRIRVVSVLLGASLLIATNVAASGAALVRGRLTDNGYRWRPASVSIARGVTQTWTAVDGRHTVTSYRGPWTKSTTLAQGTSTSFRFTQAGTYRYRCTFHSTLVSGVCSGMCGRVVVA